MTKVTFRKEKDGDILAVFAELATSYTLSCYSSVGQHGSVCLEYYRTETRPATPKEYRSLLGELAGQGYHDLKIVKRLSWARILTEKEGRG